jgi:hypothetical protein
MTPEERQQLNDLKKQVEEMKSYILGMSGNLNFKNTIAKFAREEVLQQAVKVSRETPDSEITRNIGLSGNAQTITVLAYPDKFIYLRDKDNNIHKVPAYIVTL